MIACRRERLSVVYLRPRLGGCAIFMKATLVDDTRLGSVLTRSSSANPASPGQGALEEGRRKTHPGEKKRQSVKEKKERWLEAGARACSQNADMVRTDRTG